MGLTNAALIAWKLTVSNVISRTDNAARINTPTPISTLYANPCSHWCMDHQDMGKAIPMDINTSFRKSADSIAVILFTEAPMTLRIPISFCLRCAVNAARPKSPRQEIRIANPAKYLDKMATRTSVAYCFWYASSKKLNEKGKPGL